MNLKPSAKIYSGESKIKNAGRGVFAAQEIKKDEVIESCPIILINENEVQLLLERLRVGYAEIQEQTGIDFAIHAFSKKELTKPELVEKIYREYNKIVLRWLQDIGRR
jgi:hypothetical protein